MKKSILIVDDDKNSCQNIANALSNDYMIFTASNGREALDIINKKENINLVLTDMLMPEMNGIELLERLSFLDSDIAVIMITAYFTLNLMHEAMRLGAYTVLTKPVNLNRLEISIRNALKKKTGSFYNSTI